MTIWIYFGLYIFGSFFNIDIELIGLIAWLGTNEDAL